METTPDPESAASSRPGTRPSTRWTSTPARAASNPARSFPSMPPLTSSLALSIQLETRSSPSVRAAGLGRRASGSTRPGTSVANTSRQGASKPPPALP